MKKIQLKQVLRNKRFVLFTIILPIGWYIFFYQLQKGISPSILSVSYTHLTLPTTERV